MVRLSRPRQPLTRLALLAGLCMVQAWAMVYVHPRTGRLVFLGDSWLAAAEFVTRNYGVQFGAWGGGVGGCLGVGGGGVCLGGRSPGAVACRVGAGEC